MQVYTRQTLFHQCVVHQYTIKPWWRARYNNISVEIKGKFLFFLLSISYKIRTIAFNTDILSADLLLFYFNIANTLYIVDDFDVFCVILWATIQFRMI